MKLTSFLGPPVVCGESQWYFSQRPQLRSYRHREGQQEHPARGTARHSEEALGSCTSAMSSKFTNTRVQSHHLNLTCCSDGFAASRTARCQRLRHRFDARSRAVKGIDTERFTNEGDDVMRERKDGEVGPVPPLLVADVVIVDEGSGADASDA